MGDYNMMTTEGTLLTNTRDIWDFLYHKGIDESDIYAIQEILKDCDEFVSKEIYDEECKYNADNEQYYIEQQNQLEQQIYDIMKEIDIIRDKIFSAKRLNRNTIQKDLKEVYGNLYKTLDKH